MVNDRKHLTIIFLVQVMALGAQLLLDRREWAGATAGRIQQTDRVLQTIRNNGWRRRQRLWALLAVLSLAGCGVGAGFGEDDAYDASRDMFVSGYEKIEAVYIQDVQLGDLSFAGLTQVASLDPTLAVSREADRITLKAAGKNRASFRTPPEDDTDGWGNLTADVLAAARNASPQLKDKPDEDIYDAFFTGALTKLDGFSRYSTAAEAAENRATREGFGGIGIRVAVEDGVVRVISVMNYTPAQRVGLKADDIITHVDGTPVAGLQQDEVIDMLRGPDDSHVKVTIVRNEGAPFTVDITRAHIVPETVTYERRENVAYMHLYGFNLDTADSLRKEMLHARQDIGSQLKGYVLDLRGNPGGLLDQSVAVSDLVIDDDGRIVSTHGRHPESHQEFRATAGDVADGLPIVVLVNGDSASAAEIVAAALQDSGRAVVVGSNSYGKGTVQTVLRMPNDGELTLTWARFHAPSGYTLNHLGVIPSVCTTANGSDAERLIDELRRNRLKPIPTGIRNAVDPENTNALNDLRSLCPERRGEEAIDEQVALQLLTHPSLYRRAIHLADLPPGVKRSDGAVVSQAKP
jgi:carboxyl-terminal processing protease